MTDAPLWTVKEAIGVFERQRQPVDEWRLRLIMRAVSLPPLGSERRLKGEGGRPRARYDAGALQEFHALIKRHVS